MQGVAAQAVQFRQRRADPFTLLWLQLDEAQRGKDSQALFKLWHWVVRSEGDNFHELAFPCLGNGVLNLHVALMKCALESWACLLAPRLEGPL